MYGIFYVRIASDLDMRTYKCQVVRTFVQQLQQLARLKLICDGIRWIKSKGNLLIETLLDLVFNLWLRSLIEIFNFFICSIEQFEEIEKKTGHSKAYFFTLACVTAVTLIFAIGGIKLISDLISFVYPAYASFKAIDKGVAGDDTQWLTYWIIFASCNIVESTMPFLMSWIPFYFPIKLAFFIWLYHPKFLGAGLLYTKMLRPYVGQYVEKNPQSPNVSASSLVDKKNE